MRGRRIRSYYWDQITATYKLLLSFIVVIPTFPNVVPSGSKETDEKGINYYFISLLFYKISGSTIIARDQKPAADGL